MKLLLRRDQKKGMMGGMTFLLHVKADLSEEEKANITKYGLSLTTLYEREKMPEGGSFVSRYAFAMTNLSVSVNDLWVGKKLECKSIVEMLAMEEQIKEACKVFNSVLQAAARFGGEEIVEIT
jgi:hypothetical protein